ncbi:MAG: hypothetical protein QF724_08600 [Planctomycetota bacterium]|nr:hypothetical protein [Planctomycetota bacterium]MDP6956686.1 hypothetical protein [Planctomycetota bacterium]
MEPSFVSPVDENQKTHEEPRRPFDLEAEEGRESSEQEQSQQQVDASTLEDHHADLPVSPPPAGAAGSQLDLLA